jgi:hypothetical protein
VLAEAPAPPPPPVRKVVVGAATFPPAPVAEPCAPDDPAVEEYTPILAKKFAAVAAPPVVFVTVPATFDPPPFALSNVSKVVDDVV